MNCRVAKSVVFLLIPLLAFCVQKATAQCAPPTGTSFSESFGNYSGGDPCWPGGTSSCHQSWKVTQGTSYAIAASPTGAACPNSLKLTANATRVKLQTDGTFPTLTAGTTYDVYIVFETDALLNGNALIYDLYDASGGYAVNISVGSDGKSLYAWDQGGTVSASVPFSLNAWHTAHVHVDTILANSYLQIDASATASFAPVARGPQIMEVFGTTTGNIYYQSIYINSSLGGGWPPSALIDMSGGSNGATATPSTLANSTHCGNGSWSMEGGPYLGFSSSNLQSYPALQNACGIGYQNNTGLSLKYDFSLQGIQTNNAQADYSYRSVYNASSAGTYILFDLPATDTHFMSSYTLAVPGGDYAVATEHGTGSSLQLVLECSTPPERYGAINIKPNTWYWVSLKFNLGGGTHFFNVYSASDMSLVGSTSCPSAATVPASLLVLGLSGGEPTPASGAIYYSGPILDYADAVFPLTIHAPPPDFSITTSPENLAIPAGQTGKVTLTITPVGGYSGNISFGCAGLPPGATCSVSPSPLNPTGNNSILTTNLTLTLPATVSANRTQPVSWSPADGFVVPSYLIMAVIFLMASFRVCGKVSLHWIRLKILCVFCALLLASCGSGSSNGYAPPPPNSTTYPVLVTATGENNAQTTVHSATLMVMVTK